MFEGVSMDHFRWITIEGRKEVINQKGHQLRINITERSNRVYGMIIVESNGRIKVEILN